MSKIFRTLLEIDPFNFSLSHKNSGFLVGSCFADAVGERLEQVLMPVCRNPLGVVYNPVSVCQALRRMHREQLFSAGDLFFHQELYGTFSAHSLLSAPTPEEALGRLNQAVERGAQALRESAYLIITLGTAGVYRHLKTGEVVGNCHRFPGSDFQRVRLSVTEVVEAFQTLFEEDSAFWSSKQILFTVSPIRHLRDGLTENQLSKSTLLVAVNQLTEQWPNVHYFPSYEVMMDDLRDYRFYKEDLVHPSSVAIDYIWELFCKAAFNAQTTALFEQIEHLNRSMNHLPFNPNSPQHRAFRQSMYDQTEKLSQKYPYIDFSKQLNFFSDK